MAKQKIKVECEIKTQGKYCYNGTSKKNWMNGCCRENGLLNGGDPFCDLFGADLKYDEFKELAIRCKECLAATGELK